MVLKCCTQLASIWKTQEWSQDWKRLVFIPIPKKGNAKECSNYSTIVLISHASKEMLKIIQARLQQYMNCQLPDVQTRFKKAEKPEIKLPTPFGSLKKQENYRKSSRKTSTSALLIMPKPLTAWIKTNCGKFLNSWEYQTTLCTSWEIHIQVKKQQLELNMEQWTGSKLGKEYVKAVYCHPAYLTDMQSTYIMWNAELDEAQTGIKIARRNINNLRYTVDSTFMAESEEELKGSWWKWKRRVKRLG